MPQSSSGIAQYPLFVYGTLRCDGANFTSYLQGHILRAVPGTLPGQLYLYEPGGYPYLVPGPGYVNGEILQIFPQSWDRVIVAIDRLEDYRSDDEADSWYLRRLVSALTADHQEVVCWTYYWNRPETGRLIPTGDWNDRTGDKLST